MKTHPGLPDYYVYKKDGQWFKTDASLTKAISAHIFARKTLELPKMVFYPNWDDEGPQNAKYAAWSVNEFGEMTMRWYWKVRDHSKKCSMYCHKLDNGRCAVRVPVQLEWNDATKCWQRCPLSGEATPEEVRLLDKEKNG